MRLDVGALLESDIGAFDDSSLVEIVRVGSVDPPKADGAVAFAVFTNPDTRTPPLVLPIFDRAVDEPPACSWVAL
jgi:hypothetical protein